MIAVIADSRLPKANPFNLRKAALSSSLEPSLAKLLRNRYTLKRVRAKEVKVRIASLVGIAPDVWVTSA